MKMTQNKAIIVMDYINEIVHPDGKFKGKGMLISAKKIMY